MSVYGNNIPHDWQEVTLASISKLITDGAHYSPKPQVNGRYMCSVKDMTYNKFNMQSAKLISEEDHQTLVSQGCSPQYDDLLISKDGANCLDLLFLYKQQEEISLLSSIAIVRLNDDVSKEYIRYFLLSPDCQFVMRNNFVSGSAIPRVVLKDFKNVPVLIPPLPEQKAIADVLSALDDKIDLLQRQNETLEKMAETLFRQWFIEENNFTGSIVLGEMIDIHDSKRIPLSKMEREQKKRGCILYPYYGAANIMDYIDEYIFDGNYLLIGEDGTVQDENGYPILQRTAGKFWVNNHAHIVSALEPYSNFFIWCLLSKTNVEKIITGAVQPKINQSNLKSLEFNSFDLDKVQRFVKLTTSMEEKIYINNTHIQTLQNLRDTLLPKLMSGEVRVKLD